MFLRILSLSAFLFVLNAFSQATCTYPTHTTCRVNTGTSSVITGAGGQCRVVNNTSGVDRMVAINTVNEWSASAPTASFLAYPSPNMTASACDYTPNAITFLGRGCEFGGVSETQSITGINVPINIRVHVTFFGGVNGYTEIYKNGITIATANCGFGLDVTASFSSGDTLGIYWHPCDFFCSGNSFDIVNTSDGNALLAQPYYSGQF